MNSRDDPQSSGFVSLLQLIFIDLNPTVLGTAKHRTKGPSVKNLSSKCNTKMDTKVREYKEGKSMGMINSGLSSPEVTSLSSFL